ncbi:MAG: S9 family peptidase [Planctomycetes bacterium]|nr:S9 family peptidase [Planctomycetota bacterium]
MPALLLAALPAAAQETHPFSVHDMLAMQRISDPRVSPDGRLVAFTVRDTDLDANRGRTDVWLAGLDGSPPRRLTSDPASDGNARWLDARTLVFLSTRGGSSQAWTLAIDGGEAQPLTHFPVDIENLAVFPGGQRLLFSCDVWPDAPTLQASAERDAAQAERKTSARVYDALLFRHWDAWEDGKRSHLFTWELGAEQPVDLVAGLDADVPTKPFGGFEETSISPDGKTVAFVARVSGRENAWRTNTDVYVVAADGSGPPRAVSAGNLGFDLSPSFAPDGRTLGWLEMPRAGFEADRQQVVLLDLVSGAQRRPAADWDRSAQEIVWSADGRTLYTSAANVGSTSLFAIDVASGAVRTLVDKGTNAGPQLAGNQLVFQRDTLHSPVELYAVPTAGGTPRALTALNAARVAAARMGDFEQFAFTGAHGDTVHGYIVKPVDFAEGRTYPLAFLIHGGPQGSFGDHFHYRWNPQAYAGAGFAAVMIDFHGSTGYGQAFTDSIRGDWGGAPFDDLMLGLDQVLAAYPWLDGQRVAALGASYGGYMVNWIAGQAPDRFRCLVSHDGNLDERMAYFDTEELWFPEWEHGGTPWDNPAGYAKHNPIDHVAKWKAPMLVIHGGQDFRVVDTQGMSVFTALQRRGVPSRFVHFPDENHWVLKPQNSIEWHRQVLEWITRWTAK